MGGSAGQRGGAVARMRTVELRVHLVPRAEHEVARAAHQPEDEVVVGHLVGDDAGRRALVADVARLGADDLRHRHELRHAFELLPQRRLGVAEGHVPRRGVAARHERREEQLLEARAARLADVVEKGALELHPGALRLRHQAGRVGVVEGGGQRRPVLVAGEVVKGAQGGHAEPGS